MVGFLICAAFRDLDFVLFCLWIMLDYDAVFPFLFSSSVFLQLCQSVY